MTGSFRSSSTPTGNQDIERSAGPGQRQEASVTFLPSHPKYSISLERRRRTYTAGVEAGKKLRGEVARVAPSPELQMDREFYVVLRGLHGEQGVYKRWFRNRHGAGAEEVVCEDTDDGRTQGTATVHHGFPSGTEVADYCAGAGVAVPQQIP